MRGVHVATQADWCGQDRLKTFHAYHAHRDGAPYVDLLFGPVDAGHLGPVSGLAAAKWAARHQPPACGAVQQRGARALPAPLAKRGGKEYHWRVLGPDHRIRGLLQRRHHRQLPAGRLCDATIRVGLALLALLPRGVEQRAWFQGRRGHQLGLQRGVHDAAGGVEIEQRAPQRLALLERLRRRHIFLENQRGEVGMPHQLQQHTVVFHCANRGIQHSARAQLGLL
mmetsp:Transcript_35414/g.93832  ORF Transcript_35414/g.93832 Transcript_35414/m.93832 type:complete len:225 (+) Transcript_35414:2030-2704(+)